jgi:hypothetical protein
VTSRAFGFGICLLFASVGSSCNLDPVHHAAVASLGDEDAKAYPPNSEFHRPGEPCVLCHSKKGPADSVFVLGGTVYWEPDPASGTVDNAFVHVRDSNSVDRCYVTNCNGNFFVRESPDVTFTFPLSITIERPKNPGKGDALFTPRNMGGHIGREPSCAGCHLRDVIDFGSPGPVHLFDSPNQLQESGATVVKCPPPADYIQLRACPGDAEGP